MDSRLSGGPAIRNDTLAVIKKSSRISGDHAAGSFCTSRISGILAAFRALSSQQNKIDDETS
jgi:hypothetical protein